MTSRSRRRRSLIVVLSFVSGSACQGERATVLRIGDAIPRMGGDSSLLDVVRPLLDVDGQPRVELARWKASAPDMGVGEYEQANAFVADPAVVAVVGHAGSKGTLLAKPIYTAAGVPLIVPTSTARAIGDAKNGVFTLAPHDNVIGAFLVDEAIDRLGARRVGILHVADAYGDGILDGVTERLRARGDSLVGVAALSGRECLGDGLPMEGVVRAFLQRARPDVVIVALPQQATWCAIRRLVREQPGVILITSDSYVLTKDLPLSAAERANVHSLQFWQAGNDSITRQFVARTRALLQHDPDPAEALTFDAMRLIVAAIREGHVTREAIANWLRQLGTPGHPPFEGITGPIDFKSPRTSLLRLRALRDSVVP